MENALAKITYTFPMVHTEGYKGMRQFYLADPVNAVASSQHAHNVTLETAMAGERKKGALFRLLSTHPPTYKRIEQLRELEKQL